jgi:YHS domain-containing protein
MRISRWLAAAALGVVMLGSVACTGAVPAETSAVQCRHAECPCCVHNGDLACVDVVIEPTTPSWEYQGITYYFCSEDCLNAFVKNPSKYVGH